jgi:bacterioferritin-associated ferredoxin
MIVCLCRRVSDRTIRAAIADGAQSVAEVGAACRAGTGCGACHETIEDMLHEHSASEQPHAARGQCEDCPRRRVPVLSPYVQVA